MNDIPDWPVVRSWKPPAFFGVKRIEFWTGFLNRGPHFCYRPGHGGVKRPAMDIVPLWQYRGWEYTLDFPQTEESVFALRIFTFALTFNWIP